jgi:hypothetical protein
MALPDQWVTKILTRLTVRYGSAFMRQYPTDLEPGILKADWSEVLDGIGGESISYALRFLPETPVNAMQFRAICQRAPRTERLALPEPPPDKEGIKKVANTIRQALEQASARKGTPAQKVIENILRIADEKRQMSGAQRIFARSCMEMLEHGDPLRARLLAYGVKPHSEERAAA